MNMKLFLKYFSYSIFALTITSTHLKANICSQLFEARKKIVLPNDIKNNEAYFNYLVETGAIAKILNSPPNTPIPELYPLAQAIAQASAEKISQLELNSTATKSLEPSWRDDVTNFRAAYERLQQEKSTSYVQLYDLMTKAILAIDILHEINQNTPRHDHHSEITDSRTESKLINSSILASLEYGIVQIPQFAQSSLEGLRKMHMHLATPVYFTVERGAYDFLMSTTRTAAAHHDVIFHTRDFVLKDMKQVDRNKWTRLSHVIDKIVSNLPEADRYDFDMAYFFLIHEPIFTIHALAVAELALLERSEREKKITQRYWQSKNPDDPDLLYPRRDLLAFLANPKSESEAYEHLEKIFYGHEMIDRLKAVKRMKGDYSPKDYIALLLDARKYHPEFREPRPNDKEIENTFQRMIRISAKVFAEASQQ